MGGYKTADLPSDPALVRGFAARFSKDDKTWLDGYAFEQKRSQNDVVNSALQLYRALVEGRVALDLGGEPYSVNLEDLDVTEADGEPSTPRKVLGEPVPHPATVVHPEPVFLAPAADA